MPSRRRSREGTSPEKRPRAGPKRTGKPKPKGRTTLPDPSDAPDTSTRFVQPYEARKPYVCPGCGNEIPPGLGHLVAVPASAPDLRRHWHRACWLDR